MPNTRTAGDVSSSNSLAFRIAREGWEFEAIHRLNYETFVEEIPQHPPNADRRLVDRFHSENTYVIAVRDERVVGMIALRSQRPFSLDSKLPDLDRHLPSGSRPCEIRLLATTRDSRQGFVFRGLVRTLAQHALSLGHDIALISGTTRQLRLYEHVGFVAFGPLVGTADALYQPMRLTLSVFEERGKAFVVETKPHARRALSFLPGPTFPRPAVRRAIDREPISHRSPAVAEAIDRMTSALRSMTGAERVHLLPGSGTLANDAVAQVIATWQAPGLVLSNGVFGERLVDQARRARLHFEVERAAWGHPFDFQAIERRLTDASRPSWIWAVHGETSTGVLNDLDRLRSLTERFGVRLAIDAMSSLGAVSLDLRGVAITASTSGKALGALPGVGIILRDRAPLVASASVPRSLDLELHEALDGMPHTLSSTLLLALDAALADLDVNERQSAMARQADRLRSVLPSLGLRVVAQGSFFDAVTSCALPEGWSSEVIGAALEARGIDVHYRTRELRARNWLQIALMSAPSDADIACLEGALAEILQNANAS